jgi:hypothetical protein
MIDLDLQDGLAATERRLEATGADGVRLRLGQQVLGEIPARPGAEPVRGVHLRAALGTVLAAPLARALLQSVQDGQLEGRLERLSHDPGARLRPALPLVSLVEDLLS